MQQAVVRPYTRFQEFHSCMHTVARQESETETGYTPYLPTYVYDKEEWSSPLGAMTCVVAVQFCVRMLVLCRFMKALASAVPYSLPIFRIADSEE